MTDKWIDFCIFFREEKMQLHILLVENITDEDGQNEERIITETNLRVWPWDLKRPIGLGAKVNKAKRKMLGKYKKDRKVKDLLLDAAEQWSQEWYSIVDSETEDFVAAAINKQKTKKVAKVLPFPVDK
jgi:hypothetical protein